MESKKINLKNFFLNLGAVVSLYIVVGSLINLLFTVINQAYPQVSTYNYYSPSISWPVSVVVILFPIFILLMWLLEKDYNKDPELKNSGIHRWLTYITLFLSGAIIIGDLVTVFYYFIDGRELGTGFLLKSLTLFVIVGGIFGYYISDLRNKLTSTSRNIWRVVAFVVVLGSVLWGFSVLGSPRTQRLYKYDEVKVADLQNINYAVEAFYSINKRLPKDFTEMTQTNYDMNSVDSQTKKSYEYIVKDKLSFDLCADFNKDSKEAMNVTYPVGYTSWSHPAGRYCFTKVINPNQFSKTIEAI